MPPLKRLGSFRMTLASLIRVPQRKYRRLRDVDREARIELIKHELLKWALVALYPLLMVLAVLVRAILHVLRPLVHIRFGRLWSFSIGMYTASTETYLCEKDVGLQPKRTVDIFYHYFRYSFAIKPPRKARAISNHQMAVMMRRTLRVWEPARMLDNLIRMLPGASEEFTVTMPTNLPANPLWESIPTHFSFNKQEEDRGLLELQSLGVEPGSPFVCFHARDSAYLERALPRITSVYGDWVDDMARDATIRNYVDAAEELAGLGYYAIRVGKYVKDPVKSDNPRIIDYGYNYHSDFMDVYLAAHCAFFIGQNNGLIGLPAIFRTPIAFVNTMPLTELQSTAGKRRRFIPKIYYSAEKGRSLTFREILSNHRLGDYPGKSYPDSPEYFNQIGLEIRENSPEEIAGLALELEQDIRGESQYSQEEKELQSCYRSIFGSFVEDYPLLQNYHRTRIGTHFLKIHPELLE